MVANKILFNFITLSFNYLIHFSASSSITASESKKGTGLKMSVIDCKRVGKNNYFRNVFYSRKCNYLNDKRLDVTNFRHPSTSLEDAKIAPGIIARGLCKKNLYF